MSYTDTKFLSLFFSINGLLKESIGCSVILLQNFYMKTDILCVRKTICWSYPVSRILNYFRFGCCLLVVVFFLNIHVVENIFFLVERKYILLTLYEYYSFYLAALEVFRS